MYLCLGKHLIYLTPFDFRNVPNSVMVNRGLFSVIACSSKPYFSITLSYQGPAKRPKPVEQGVTIFPIHKLNDVNTAKNHSPAVT